MQRLEILFGTTAASETYTPTAAASGFTLRGSFVHAEPQRSSAIVRSMASHRGCTGKVRN